MIEIATQIDTLKSDQAFVARALSNSITSNNLVLRTLCNLTDEQFDVLNQFISPVVEDGNAEEVGWEELTQASTAHLLRTCLSRKDKGNNPPNAN